MEAVLLAGGFGTRLLPLTKARPKVMIPLLNRPIIEHVIDQLPPMVDRILFAVGYKHEMLSAYFDGREDREYAFFVEEEPLGTGGAVKNCERGITGRFLVLNADGLCSLDIPALLALHTEKKGMATLSLWKVEDPEPYGIVDMDEDGRIKSFVEKPKREEAPSLLANAGTYVLEKEVLDFIPSGMFVSIERETFPRIVPHGFYGLPFTGYYLDAGDLRVYLDTQRHLLSIQGRQSLVEGTAVVNGSLGENVCLGREVELAVHSKLSNASLLDSVRVGEGTIIQSSIIGEGCVLGKNVRVQGSILGDGVAIDDGVHLDGARIDPGKTVTGNDDG